MGRKKQSCQGRFMQAVLWSVAVELAAWLVSTLLTAGIRWLLTPGDDA